MQNQQPNENHAGQSTSINSATSTAQPPHVLHLIRGVIRDLQFLCDQGHLGKTALTEIVDRLPKPVARNAAAVQQQTFAESPTIPPVNGQQRRSSLTIQPNMRPATDVSNSERRMSQQIRPSDTIEEEAEISLQQTRPSDLRPPPIPDEEEKKPPLPARKSLQQFSPPSSRTGTPFERYYSATSSPIATTKPLPPTPNPTPDPTLSTPVLAALVPLPDLNHHVSSGSLSSLNSQSTQRSSMSKHEEAAAYYARQQQQQQQQQQQLLHHSLSIVEAMWDFYGDSEDGDLSFKKGDLIEVIERVNTDWWRGRIYYSEGSKMGIFPGIYTRVVSQVNTEGYFPPQPQPNSHGIVYPNQHLQQQLHSNSGMLPAHQQQPPPGYVSSSVYGQAAQSQQMNGLGGGSHTSQSSSNGTQFQSSRSHSPESLHKFTQ